MPFGQRLGLLVPSRQTHVGRSCNKSFAPLHVWGPSLIDVENCLLLASPSRGSTASKHSYAVSNDGFTINACADCSLLVGYAAVLCWCWTRAYWAEGISPVPHRQLPPWRVNSLLLGTVTLSAWWKG